MNIEEVMTMESLERSAARRRTLSNTSSTASSKASSSISKHQDDRTPGGKAASTSANKSKVSSNSTKSQKKEESGETQETEEDCDETTPFTGPTDLPENHQHLQTVRQKDQTTTTSSRSPSVSSTSSPHRLRSHQTEGNPIVDFSPLICCPASPPTTGASPSLGASSSLSVSPAHAGAMTDVRAGKTDNDVVGTTTTTTTTCDAGGACSSSMNWMREGVDDASETVDALGEHDSVDPSSSTATTRMTLDERLDQRRGTLLPSQNELQQQQQQIQRQSPQHPLHQRQLVSLSNTPAAELLHARLPTEINTHPQPAMTVIAIDPASGTSYYSQQPTTFVFSGFSTAVAPSTAVAVPSVATGGVAPSSAPALRTVCGACGGVMPPPGMAIGSGGGGGGAAADSNNAAVLGSGGGGVHHQSLFIASPGHENSGQIHCNPLDGEDQPAAGETLHSSSTSTSLQTSVGTPANVDICRICHCEGEEPDAPLIAPCYCTGSLRWVHQSCLQQWIKSSETRKCELCKFEFIMETKIKPFPKWEKLQMTTVERRKIMCSVTFHAIAITCVIWSLYVLIDRTTDEVKKGNLEWPFWTKLIVVAIGFIGGLVFMYVQFKMYIALCRRWRAFNRVIYVQDIPDALLTSSKEKQKASRASKGRGSGVGGGGSGEGGGSGGGSRASASKENTPDMAAVGGGRDQLENPRSEHQLQQEQQLQQHQKQPQQHRHTAPLLQSLNLHGPNDSPPV